MKRKSSSLFRQKLRRATWLALASGIFLFGQQALVFASSPPADRKVPTQYFMTNPQGFNASMWELVQRAMENWHKYLGVPFEAKVLDHDQLNSEGLFQGKFDVRIQYFSGIPIRLDPAFMLISRFYATCKGYYPRISKEDCPDGGGPFNSMGYYSPEFNKLMDEQQSIFNYEKRKKVVDKAIELTVKDRPTLVLFSPNIIHLMNTKNWENEKPTVGEGLSSFWNTMAITPKGSDKTLKIGSLYTVPTLNPLTVVTAQGYRVNRLIYDRLMRISPEGRPVNWMAQDISVTKGPNGPKTALVIKIRKGMKFHDGVPVTAADVKFTFDYDKEHKAPNLAEYLKHVTSVEQVDDYTVKVNLKAPWSSIEHVLLARMLIIPKHIWEKIDNPLEFANAHPIGSGPFEFESWERGSQLVLKKNPDYFHSFAAEVLVRVPFKSAELLAEAIERGEIDIEWGGPMQADIALRAEKMKNVKLVKAENNGIMVFDLRVAKRPYSDPVFRKALEYCLPRKQMIQQLYNNFADYAVSTIPPGNKAWYDPNALKYAVEYNPEKGRQILKDAGYEWDSSGALYYPPKK